MAQALNDSESELDDAEGVNLFQDRPEVLVAEVPTDSDDESGEELNVHRTRKEQKALDRELPWREITRMSPEVAKEFRKAALIEYENWMAWKSAREVPREEARSILRDKIRARRVLRSRMCYRDKNVGVPPLRAKARCVVIGCGDPDLAELERNSPTPSRTSFMLVMQVFASGKLDPDGEWLLLNADATAAFLQGMQELRPDKLYMLPPRDGVVKDTDVFPGILYEITGNVYGLANAPVTWAREVVKRMKSLGFVQHSVDSMLFYHIIDGKLAAIGIFHVDDLILACRRLYDLTGLKTAFKWGAMHFAPEVLTFCGREVRDLGDRVLITQVAYAEGTQRGNITRERAKGDPVLTASETTEHRSCGGALGWLGNISRPDIMAGTSLAKCGQPTLDQLKKLYELVDYTQLTKDAGIVLRPLPLDPAQLIVVSYADASFANAPNLKSQGGLLVCLTTRDALTGSAVASVLDWKSGRLRRVVRSTLAAEACSADAGVDHGMFIGLCLTELVGKGDAISSDSVFEHYHATDCRSLYDCVHKNSSDLEEKRTLLDVKAIRHAIIPRNLLWVPTDQMHADGLTKDQIELRARFREWLQDPRVQLYEE